MITSERDEFVGFHTTIENKDSLRVEAERRKMSMSLLLSTIVEEWLGFAKDEQLEPRRSNKRYVNPNEIDVPLPFPEENK